MKWLIVSLLAFTLIACEQVSTYEPETRPKNIPTSAVWVGGPDGGVYTKITESNGNYFGAIYYDRSGDTWYEGKFIYTGQEAFDVNNRNSYSAWDGDILYLTNGQKLIAKRAKGM